MINWTVQESMGLEVETRCRLLEKATERFPERAESWYLLGAALLDSHQHATAEDAFRNAIGLEPTHINALSGLGLVYQRQGKFDQAIEIYLRCLNDYPDAVSTYESLASTYLASSQPELAAKTYQQLLTSQPNHQPALTMLADIYIRTGKPDQALNYLMPFIKTESANTHSLALRVLIHGLQKELPQARALLAKDQFFSCVESNAAHSALHDRLCSTLETAPKIWEPLGYTLRNGASVSQLTQFSDSDLQELLSMIRQQVDSYIADLKQQETSIDHPFVQNIPDRACLDAWASIQQKGGHELPHIHRRAWLSGVYYLKVAPENANTLAAQQPGSIEFCDYPYDKEEKAFDDLRFSLQPKAGQMLLFPSFYYHRTWPHATDDKRIMVAFDVIAE